MDDDEAKEVVGKNVERLRKARDMSRYKLAKEVKASTIQITRIERCEHAPGAGLMTRLAKALQVSLNDLVQVQ